MKLLVLALLLMVKFRNIVNWHFYNALVTHDILTPTLILCPNSLDFFYFKVSLYWGLHSNQMVLLISSILALLYFMCKAQLIYMYKHERALSCGTPKLNPAVKEPSFDQNCIFVHTIPHQGKQITRPTIIGLVSPGQNFNVLRIPTNKQFNRTVMFINQLIALNFWQ